MVKSLSAKAAATLGLTATLLAISTPRAAHAGHWEVSIGCNGENKSVGQNTSVSPWQTPTI